MVTDPPLEHLWQSLTEPERVKLVNGSDTWSTTAVPRIGLRPIAMSDGPSGVRGVTWDERVTAVSFPCGVALGATFDDELMVEVGRALGAEAHRLGVQVLLGPTINVQRSPFAGRHFEYFSEDPYLTAALASAYVAGLQSTGVAASPKHFVCNDSETGRREIDVRVPPHQLRGIYLLPFEAVVKDAGTWSVMVAYNRVSGLPMTEHTPLLGGVLKTEWLFDGVAISDWGAVTDPLHAALGPLDLAMPGPGGPWGSDLRDLLSTGPLTSQALRDKVIRLLGLARRVGSLDASTVPGPAHQNEVADPATFQTAGPAVARQAATGSLVLLTNDHGALPLRPADLSRVAVIGPNAEDLVTQGGGSAAVNATTSPTPAEALRAVLGADVEVVTAVGCRTNVLLPALGSTVASVEPVTGRPGVAVQYIDRAGRVLFTDVRRDGRLVWYGRLPAAVDADEVVEIAVRAAITAPSSGNYVVGVAGLVTQELFVDGRSVLLARRPADVPFDDFLRPDEHRHQLHLQAGVYTEIEVRQAFDSARNLDICYLGADVELAPADRLIGDAVDLAASADVAVVIVGTNAEVESEGFDRPDLDLPGWQDELVRQVCAVNRRTIVVVNAGGPVNMPWLSEAAATMVCWFAGQAAAEGLARALVGIDEPGGRLPFTWPSSHGAPWVRSTLPEDGTVRYDEDEVANRRVDVAAEQVLFPFGHGLGYTSWQLGTPRLLAGTEGGDEAPVCTFGTGRYFEIGVPITNTGRRDGSQVVQVYADVSVNGRMERRMVGFKKCLVPAAETSLVSIGVPARMLENWEEDEGSWKSAPVLDVGVATTAAGPFQLVANWPSPVRDALAAGRPAGPPSGPSGPTCPPADHHDLAGRPA